jgi:hypothetical protein
MVSSSMQGSEEVSKVSRSFAESCNIVGIAFIDRGQHLLVSLD